MRGVKTQCDEAGVDRKRVYLHEWQEHVVVSKEGRAVSVFRSTASKGIGEREGVRERERG